MSRFILKAGLVLGLLSGVVAVSSGVVPQRVASAEEFQEDDHEDFGPYDDYEYALTLRDIFRLSGYAANIIEDDRGYWVRRFDP